MSENRIVAIGLLTQRDLDLLGGSFSRAFPVEDITGFEELLQKVDEADASRTSDQTSSFQGVTNDPR